MQVSHAEPVRVGRLIAALIDRQLTIAVAESLTGGLVCAALTSVPGSSVCVRGAVVSYATDLKASLLGVTTEALAAHGPVDPTVAKEMARGAARLCGADIGIATTGVAGPQSQDGIDVGTVFVAAHDTRDGSDRVLSLMLLGDRASIRSQTVHRSLDLAAAVVEGR